MDELYDQIRTIAKGYFDRDFIESFILTIDKYAKKSQKYFFQLTQKDNKPTLEFSCKTSIVIFDAVASVGEIFTTTVLLSSLNIMMLNESVNKTQLDIKILNNNGLFYIAVTDEYRKFLRDYADYLQSNIFGG